MATMNGCDAICSYYSNNILLWKRPFFLMYYSRSRNPEAPEWCEYVDSMDELCTRVDVLSVHVPLRPDTINLVGEKQIRAMKRGSILVNTARGKVVDEEALLRALDDGHVRTSALVLFCWVC